MILSQKKINQLITVDSVALRQLTPAFDCFILIDK